MSKDFAEVDNCINCVYGLKSDRKDSWGDSLYYCRRYPPAIPKQIGLNVISCQDLVFGRTWCEEHKPK